MNKRIIILALLAGGLFFSACQKDIDVFVPDAGQLNGPDTTWQTIISSTAPVVVLKNDLLIEPYRDTIIVNANIATVNTPFGMQISFPPNCCINAGAPVTGKVDVEIQVAKKKGDMIRLDKPTTYNDSLLTTAGQIFIQLKKNGQALQLAAGVRLTIKYVDLPVNQQMKFFIGDESSAQFFNWLPTPTPQQDSVAYGAQQYEIHSSRQRWISLATGFNSTFTTPKVKVSADVENYFTNANTVAFTVFKDTRTVAAMQGNISTRKFTSIKLPAGKQVTVVVISKQAGDYYLGYESAVTQAPASTPGTQTVHVVPIKKSLPEILSYLNTL